MCMLRIKNTKTLWFLWLLLTGKLLNQGFLLIKLKSSLRKFYGRHHDLVDRYGTAVSQMTTDMFHLSQTLPIPFLIHDLSLIDLLFYVLCFVDRCLYFFFWPLCCLSFFDLHNLIIPLVSSNSSSRKDIENEMFIGLMTHGFLCSICPLIYGFWFPSS
jgi:hypothetical protein